MRCRPAAGSLSKTRRVTVGPEPSPAAGERPAAFVRVTIQDSGCGIAPDVLPRIFEPLYTTRPAGKGAGLGLAIVNEVVTGTAGGSPAEHGRPGNGRFVVYLPAVIRIRNPAPAGRLACWSSTAIRNHPAIDRDDSRAGVVSRRGDGSLPQAVEWTAGHEGQVDLVLISGEVCTSEADALSELVGKIPGAGLLVTTGGEVPYLPPACKDAFRGVVPRPSSARPAAARPGRPCGEEAPPGRRADPDPERPGCPVPSASRETCRHKLYSGSCYGNRTVRQPPGQPSGRRGRPGRDGRRQGGWPGRAGAECDAIFGLAEWTWSRWWPSPVCRRNSWPA